MAGTEEQEIATLLAERSALRTRMESLRGELDEATSRHAEIQRRLAALLGVAAPTTASISQERGEAIVRLLREERRPMRTSEISGTLGITRDAAKAALMRLLYQREVKRAGRFGYALETR